MSRLIVSAVATASREQGFVRVEVSVSEAEGGAPVEGLKKANITAVALGGATTNLSQLQFNAHSPAGFYQLLFANVNPVTKKAFPIGPDPIEMAVVVNKKKDKARVGEDPFHRGQVVVQAP